MQLSILVINTQPCPLLKTSSTLEDSYERCMNVRFLDLQMNFGGECILYADVIERKIEFGAASKCTFVTYLHVVLSVLYATLLAGLYSVMTFKRFKDTELKYVEFIVFQSCPVN